MNAFISKNLFAALTLSLSASVAAANQHTKALPKKSVPAATATPAATANRSTASATVLRPTAPSAAKFSMGGLLSTANTMAANEISVNTPGQKIKGGLDFSTNSALAVTAQYENSLPFQLPNNSVGKILSNVKWIAGGTIENTREFESISGVARGNFEAKPSMQPWIAHGGATYAVNDKVSIPVALNYTVFNSVKSGSFKEFSMTPDLGYQLGVAFQPNPNLQIEILNRETRYFASGKGEGFQADFGQVRLNGLAVAGRYVF